MNMNADSRDMFEANGFIALNDLCQKDLVSTLLDISKNKLNEQLAKLEGKEIGIGSAEGYSEICQRSVGRWDVPIDLNSFGIDDRNCPWWPYVANLLGEDANCAHQGVVSSAPNTPAQQWHMDSPHTSKEHLPVHAINVLIALEDIDETMGPTEFTIGSHRHTNHLKNPNLVSDELVYQCDKTSPETLMSENQKGSFEIWTSPLRVGSALIFDDRILHRGGANKSEKFRHVAYFSYSRKGYVQQNYFESDRSLS